jgi:hypothetical protein
MLQIIKRIAKRFNSGHSRGQGLIETALLVPVLLMVLSGLVEFGFFLNDYLALQDAARNAARFSADGSYTSRDSLNCANTRDFYRQTACLVNQELAQERPEIELDFGTGIDDIVISVFSIAQDFCTSPSTFPPVQSLPPGSGISCVSARHPTADGEAGWSSAQDTSGTRAQSSRFSSAEINARLSNLAPSTGLVIVELTYTYDQKLKLPWITAFISDPVVLHNYALMPLVSAEPTPTPVP